MQGTRHLVRSLPLFGEELVGIIKVDARMNARSRRGHSSKRMLKCVSGTSTLTFYRLSLPSLPCIKLANLERAPFRLFWGHGASIIICEMLTSNSF